MRAGLSPNTVYQWAIITQFANIKLRQVMTDMEGTLTIDTSVFQDGHFNEHSGTYTLTVLDTERVPVKLVFNGQEYDIVKFDFQKVDSTDIIYKNVIE